MGGPNAVAAAARLQGSADLFDKAWESGLPGNLACGRRPAFGLNAVSSPSGVPTSKIVDDSLWHHPPYQDSACAPQCAAIALALISVRVGIRHLERVNQHVASLAAGRHSDGAGLHTQMLQPRSKRCLTLQCKRAFC